MIGIALGGGQMPFGIDFDDEIDWSKIDKPVKLTVTERVDIDNLQAFAGSEEGKKEISTFYPEEEDNDSNEDQLDNVFDGKTAREIILMFLQNIGYQKTYKVSFAWAPPPPRPPRAPPPPRLLLGSRLHHHCEM